MATTVYPIFHCRATSFPWRLIRLQTEPMVLESHQTFTVLGWMPMRVLTLRKLILGFIRKICQFIPILPIPVSMMPTTKSIVAYYGVYNTELYEWVGYF